MNVLAKLSELLLTKDPKEKKESKRPKKFHPNFDCLIFSSLGRMPLKTSMETQNAAVSYEGVFIDIQ